MFRRPGLSIMSAGLTRRCVRTISGDFFRVHPEVEGAVRSHKPVVALESTILTHGMPYPENLAMAKSVQQIIRDNGAVPATVALLDGRAFVGLDDAQLEEIADPANRPVKVSKRDIAVALNKRLYGGTTISGTMVLASKAGIRVFVSGGLGGVHHGGELSMDVSNDLTELGRTPIAVITSGVKSILDIGRTLEYLETQGVCVLTFGPTTEFPAFFTSKSGHQSPSNVATIDEAASVIHTALQLQLNSGVLLAVPIPAEYELEGQVIEGHIQQALGEAREARIGGRDVTPYVLRKVNELSAGRSLKANIALVKNNALVGAQVAVRLASKMKGSGTGATGRRSYSTRTRPVVIGACNLDTVYQLQSDELQYHGATNEAKSAVICGGVGRNLSDALCRLGTANHFLTALGQDVNGEMIRWQCRHMDWSLARLRPDRSTAVYTVVLAKDGEPCLGVGDMAIHDDITPDYIRQHKRYLEQASMIIMDGNISEDAMKSIYEICTDSRKIFYEPTDVHKATKPFNAGIERGISFIKPNKREAAEICKVVTGQGLESDATLDDMIAMCSELTHYIPNILLTLGSNGVLFCTKDPRYRSEAEDDYTHNRHGITCVKVAPKRVDKVKSLSGAGDCLAAGFIHGILSDLSVRRSLELGVRAAALSAESYSTVPDSLTALAS